ncbi:hypothetical protein OOK36_09375 [Streptomyces sp. NBC_00365]|uniref:hypothetical protein n=1 Tax=Streptomyces sp. NBC_00365 TaxID=2975726 RepID=UPI002253B567|nr:hypothetical protein [Streptomyces sp. NBC_00365]MCX5089098.1 hypothetical protein [Streptomyces sp. NBC_00365]
MLVADDRGGYVLAHEKDPDNHIAVRGHAETEALLSGNAAHAFDAPRTLSCRVEGTPDITSVHDGTVEPTGDTEHASTPPVNSAPPSGTSRPGTPPPTGGRSVPWSPGVCAPVQAATHSSNSAAGD